MKKKEKTTQNLAYIAIMAAINIVAVLLSSFVPALIFVLVFFLPLSAALVTYFCKIKFLPIFLIVTLTVSCFVNLTDTLFYVFPALLSGIVLGIIIDKNIDFSIGITLCLLINIGTNYLSTYLYSLIFERNIFEDLLTIFNLSSNVYAEYFVSLYVFFISLAQVVISVVVLRDGFKKLAIDAPLNFYPFNEGIAGIIFSCLSIIASTINGPLSFQFLLLGFVIIAKSLLSGILTKNYLVIGMFGASVLGTIFLFAFINDKVMYPYPFLSLILVVIMVSIAFIINKCLVNKQIRNKIK